jgi:F-type H+-transporting ATPase subunit gamma
MPIPTRIIRRRIKSIRSTRKIMKAMELVAASKMRKAVQLALATRAYADLIRELSLDVRKLVESGQHPLLAGRGRVGKSLLVVAASDRGLCGGFNGQLVKSALGFVRARGEEVAVVTIGRRAEHVTRRSGKQLLASFETISNAPSFERIRPIAGFLLEEFLSGRVDRIFFAFTRFKSALTQVPVVRQLLPVIPEEELAAWSARPIVPEVEEEDTENRSDLVFEPSPDRFLQGLLPRMFEMQVYQSLLESAASEHSARMLAMRSAGDAASDMVDSLTFTQNQARQAAITREISEISAGKAAIE